MWRLSHRLNKRAPLIDILPRPNGRVLPQLVCCLGSTDWILLNGCTKLHTTSVLNHISLRRRPMACGFYAPGRSSTYFNKLQGGIRLMAALLHLISSEIWNKVCS